MYFSCTLIDLFNSSDESAALLGRINSLFKCVCPDTVYQNKGVPSSRLQPESLTYLFGRISLFFLFFRCVVVWLERWAVLVARPVAPRASELG